MLEHKPNPSSDSEIASAAIAAKLKKGKKRLSNCRITTLSLCRRGVNGVRSLFKSADEDSAEFELFSRVSKMDATEGLLHTLVYVPEVPDYDNEVMSAAEIRKAAHDFFRIGGHIDVEHDGELLDREKVHVAEHYIVTSKDDPKFAGITDEQGDPIDPTGAWGVVLKINDPELRASYARGDWTGISMFGRAKVEVISKAQPSRQPNKEELQMTPEDRAELERGVAKAVAEAIAPLLAPKAQPAVSAPERDMPTPPTDLNDVDALEQFADDLFVKSLDLSNQEDVKRLIKHRREQAVAKAKREAPKPETKAPQGEETELAKSQRENAELKAKIEKIEKSSNVPAKDGDKKQATGVRGLKEDEQAQWTAGSDLAQRIAKSKLKIA